MSINTSEGLSPYDDGSAVSEIIESFVESTTKLAESLDAPEEYVRDFKQSGEELANLVEKIAQESIQASESAQTNKKKVEELQDDLEQERTQRGKDDASIKSRVSDLEDNISAETPTPNTGKTTIQQSDLTPIEQLAQADDVSEVTESASVERAVSLFRNLPNWGKKTPKGYCLRPKDNPRSLLEADQDEDLCWKQYYRAAKTLEQLSKGAVTFFDSDRHGKMVVLHEQSEVFDRVRQGSLSSSSVEAST